MDIYTFSAPLEEYRNKLWKYHIKAPKELTDLLKNKKVKRFLAIFNNKVQIHASLMPAGEGVYFIKINSSILKKLRIKVGDILQVTIKEDTSKYGMTLAEEMQILLNDDQEASAYFEQLTPGKQRSLLYLVSQIKSSPKRLEKSFIILEHLKEQNGKLDFKILNQDFKNKKGVI